MDNLMEDKRRSPRKRANQLLSVLDRGRGEILGNLVDISNEGLMLISKKAIDTDKVWQIDMELPQNINGSNTVQFGAESLWCDDTGGSNQFWIGFQIIDIATEESEKIKQLMNKYLN